VIVVGIIRVRKRKKKKYYDMSVGGKRYEVLVLKRGDAILKSFDTQKEARKFARRMARIYPKEKVSIYDWERKRDVRW
jgi:hypothetical protein